MLVTLDRTHEARVETYRQAVNTNILKIRVRNLKQTLTNKMRDQLDADLMVEQINLGERLALPSC